MRVNWFSPLPPTECDTADLTRAVLAHLVGRAEVTLWTSRSGWDVRPEQAAHVRLYHPAQMPWDEVNRADATVYLFGRDAGLHGCAREVSRLHPGLVVLLGGAAPVERALAVLRPTEASDCADLLLRMAGNAAAASADEVARNLAALAAAELSIWTTASADVGLRRVATAIHELFIGAAPDDAARRAA